MANNKRSEKDYPIVKYRIVNGNGYTICNSEEELQEKLERYIKFADSLNERDKNRFMPKYVVKVTEEYLRIEKISNNFKIDIEQWDGRK